MRRVGFKLVSCSVSAADSPTASQRTHRMSAGVAVAHADIFVEIEDLDCFPGDLPARRECRKHLEL
jgi:hypothetical protein